MVNAFCIAKKAALETVKSVSPVEVEPQYPGQDGTCFDTWLHNPKHHPARPHAAASQQPTRQRRHRPTRSPAHAMAHQTGRRRAPHTRHPRAPPHRHVPLPRPTPATPGPSALCALTPTTPPRAPVARLRQHPAHRLQGTIRRPRHKPNRHPSGTTTHLPGQQCSPQTHHLAVAPPLTRARTQALDPAHATVPADTPRSADPGN